MRSLGTLVLVLLLFLSACEQETARTQAPFSLIDEAATAMEYDGARLQAAFGGDEDDDVLVRTVTFNGRSERALTLPLPSRARYRMTVPDGASFRFAFSLRTPEAARLNAPATVRVVAEDSGEEHELFLRDFPIRQPEPKENAWWDGTIDLSAFAGRDVALTLEAGWSVERPVRQPVAVAWGDPVVATPSSPATARPPLILVSIDCLRADHVGAYGYERDTTPNIDALAAKGELFESAFSTASWTLPSHMSMLTGELPSIHGATKWEKLDEAVPYLPEVLARAGYRTAGVVSWVYLSQAYGFERGFDYYEVLPDPEASDIVDRALAELDRSLGRELFLFVHLYDPHWPYLPPEDLIEAFGPRPEDLSELLRRIGDDEPPARAKDVEEARRLYDGEIAFADRELGRLFDALEARGLFDEALILITADHGEAFFEHGHWEHSQTLFDEVTRVPFIIKWPGNEPRGRRSDLASLTDVYATLAEAAGASAHEHEPRDGQNLMNVSSERMVVSEYETRSPLGTSLTVALRTENEKYIAFLEGKPGADLLDMARLESESLYDLVDDPGETTDVSVERASSVERFRESLAAFLHDAAAARASRQAEEVELDPETLEQLERLGYVDTRP